MKSKIELRKGDIAEMDADAVVNPANVGLMLLGGVSVCIARAGGPSIQAECNKIGRIRVGEAVVTGAGTMKAKYVIHASGPGRGRITAQTVRMCTKNSLLRADEKRVKTIAFPAIGTGVACFPLDECARVMFDVVLEHLKGKTTIEKVYFVLYGQKAFNRFKKQYDALPG